MAKNLCEIDPTGTRIAVADRNEAIVFDWKTLQPIWRQTFPGTIVGLGFVHNGLMVLDDSGQLTCRDWSRGEVIAEMTLNGDATGLSTTFDNDSAVFLPESVIVIIAGETIATIPISNVTAGAWSPNGSALAIGNEDGEFFVYERGDIWRSFNPVPILTSIFDQRIDGIAWIEYDFDQKCDYWFAASGNSLWTIEPPRGGRQPFAQNLPDTVNQLACSISGGMIAFASRFRVIVLDASVHRINMAVEKEVQKAMIADIDYRDQIVTGIKFTLRQELLISRNHAAADLVNLADGELFAIPRPGRSEEERKIEWRCAPENIPGLKRLPELNLNVQQVSTWNNPRIGRLYWWIAPILGMIVGAWFGFRIAVSLPHWGAAVMIAAYTATGFVTGLVIFGFDFRSNPRQ